MFSSLIRDEFFNRSKFRIKKKHNVVANIIARSIKLCIVQIELTFSMEQIDFKEKVKEIIIL